MQDHPLTKTALHKATLIIDVNTIWANGSNRIRVCVMKEGLLPQPLVGEGEGESKTGPLTRASRGLSHKRRGEERNHSHFIQPSFLTHTNRITGEGTSL